MRPIGDILSDRGIAGKLSPFELKLTQTHQSLQIKDQVHIKQSGYVLKYPQPLYLKEKLKPNADS